MDINQIIGKNLHRLRMEQNLSLGQLAEAAGISKVILSQIEKGGANPTVSTIWKIAAGLRVPYTSLMERQEEHIYKIGENELLFQEDEDGHYRICCYYPYLPTRNFEWFMIELDPGTTHASAKHSNYTQEYIIVHAGELTMEIDGTLYQAGANESLWFTASGTHVYSNRGSELLKASILIYYSDRN